MKKGKLLYSEKYKGDGLELPDENKPELTHCADGYSVKKAFVKELRCYESNDEVLEMQVLHVYVRKDK